MEIKPLDTREKIIKAAREVFIEKGKDGARMQEIADRAKVNKALLHYYYSSKDNLYNEVIVSAFGRFFKQMSQIFLEVHSLEETIERFVDRHIDFIMENRDMIKLFISQVIREDQDLMQTLGTLARDNLQLPVHIQRLFIENMQNGRIRPHNPGQTIISLISLNVFYFVISPFARQIVPETFQDEKKFLAERKQAIVDLVLHGILTK